MYYIHNLSLNWMMGWSDDDNWLHLSEEMIPKEEMITKEEMIPKDEMIPLFLGLKRKKILKNTFYIHNLSLNWMMGSGDDDNWPHLSD